MVHQLRQFNRMGLGLLGVAVVAGGVVAGAHWVGAAPVASTGEGVQAAASPSPTVWATAIVFRDVSSANTFSIQLQAGRPDTGSFDYSVSGCGEDDNVDTASLERGCGDYLGTASLGREDQSGNVEIAWSGTAVFDPSSGEPLGHASVKLEGQVLRNGSALVLDIWINGVHTHFATGNASASLGSHVAQVAVGALAGHAWATFYGLLTPEERSHFGSEQAFASAVSSQDGQIVSASLTGAPRTSSGDGEFYFVQSVALTVTTPSGPAAYSTNIYLVFEDGTWLVIGTDPPSPA